ncbi:MAG TPA: metal-dependent transcriptional regulator [Sulfolobales archaeon]|nr:metal-dependent transcriptional regulator [Sulfolobales archaeon]
MERSSYENLYSMIRRGHNRKERRKTTVEEYLETIHELEKHVGWVRTKDLSRVLNIKPSSITKTLKKLHSEGLIIYEKYRGARLSRAGLEAINKLVRKHRVLAELLKEAGLSEIDAQAEAERLEHLVPDYLVEYLEKFLLKYRETLRRCGDKGSETL